MAIHLQKNARGRPILWAAVAALGLTASAVIASDRIDNRHAAMIGSGSASTTHIVEIRDFRFSPETLTVKVGDSIVWRNLDVVPHTATDQSRAWDSGNLGKGDEWTFTADAAGSFDYLCAYHPSMTGVIRVEN